MRNATWDQRTILQTHDPADGDRYVTVATLEGVTLPLNSPTALKVDGDRWHVVRCRSDVDTQTRTVVTTATVIKDSGVTITIHPAAPEHVVSHVVVPYPDRRLPR